MYNIPPPTCGTQTPALLESRGGLRSGPLAALLAWAAARDAADARARAAAAAESAGRAARREKAVEDAVGVLAVRVGRIAARLREGGGRIRAEGGRVAGLVRERVAGGLPAQRAEAQAQQQEGGEGL
jgi:hypothetical protein